MKINGQKKCYLRLSLRQRHQQWYLLEALRGGKVEKLSVATLRAELSLSSIGPLSLKSMPSCCRLPSIQIYSSARQTDLLLLPSRWKPHSLCTPRWLVWLKCLSSIWLRLDNSRSNTDMVDKRASFLQNTPPSQKKRSKLKAVLVREVERNKKTDDRRIINPWKWTMGRLRGHYLLCRRK